MRYIEDEDIKNNEYNEKSLIIVRMMTGKEHTLLTNERDETYHDIKVALLPHLSIDPAPFLRQLVFKVGDTYSDVDDRMIVYNNNNNIRLELIIADPVWNEEEQERINSLINRERVMLLWCDIQNIPSEIEMFLWGMRSNTCVKSLWIDHIPIMDDVNFMNVINDHDTIEDLTVTSNGMNADEMSEFFDMIVEKNTNILNFSIMHNNTYRLDDLSTLLRKNKSLREVTILNCDVQVSEYSSTLADVLSDLSDTHPFEKLDIFNSRIFGDEKSIKALIDSLQLIKLSELDISDNEIKHLRWVRNNL